MDQHPDPISTIAHKIRTPLTVISSTINNFLDGVYGTLSGKQVDWMKKLESHTSHLEQLLDQILNLIKERPDKAAQVQSFFQTHQQTSNIGKKSDSSSNAISVSKDQPLILVVDDEPDVQDVIRQGLEMQGYRVLTMSTAEEGIAAAHSENPDVILMDLFLNDQNGLDVAKKIKQEIASFIPIVIITGQDDLRTKMAEFRDQADDLLAKPFQISELGIRVGSMLRLKRLHDRRPV